MQETKVNKFNLIERHNLLVILNFSILKLVRLISNPKSMLREITSKEATR